MKPPVRKSMTQERNARRDWRTGRLTNMDICEHCHRRGELEPAYELPDGHPLLGLYLHAKCIAKINAGAKS